MKLVDLNYHCHSDITDPQQVIDLHAPSSGYIDPIRKNVQLVMVKHMAHEGLVRQDEINYHFFKSKNRFWYIPFRTHRFLKKMRPDVIMVHGFVFPLQVMALRRMLGVKPVILVQHQGDKPYRNKIKAWFQRRADKAIDGYLFTAKGNARPWQLAKVIRDENKCFELLSASSPFTNGYRKKGDATLRLSGDPVFLWVARLNANKDPLGILKTFLRFLEVQPRASLYFVYQTTDLLADLESCMKEYPQWQHAVHFIGKKERSDLEEWFNVADFYISGSHSEGSGYALAEAMACGCIPVVTNIPSFLKITNDGQLGLHFEPGNPDSCYDALLKTIHIDRQQMSNAAAEYAKQHLGYQAIADQLFGIASQLINRRAP